MSSFGFAILYLLNTRWLRMQRFQAPTFLPDAFEPLNAP